MRSWRRASALICAGASVLSLLACGSDGGSGGGGGGPAPAPTGPDPSQPSAPGTPANPDEAPVALTEMLAGFDWAQGFVQGASGRLFSITPGVASSLARVTVVKTSGDKADVLALPVVGKLPAGRIEAMAYAQGIDRFVMILRAQRPHRLEVISVQITDGAATFETLAQPAPLAPDGAMFTALYPKGGGALLALRGNDLLTLTVAPGGQATWSAPSSAQNFYRGNSTSIVLDAQRGRLVAYGRDVYDPQTKTMRYEPTVGTMSLAGPYAWNDVSLGNVPPAKQQGVAPNWAAFDTTGERLLGVVYVDDTCGTMPCVKPTLWEAKLSQGQWAKVTDFFNAPTMYKPFATDDVAHRVLTVGDGALSYLSIDAQSNLKSGVYTQTGDIGPSAVAGVAVLSSGKILASDGNAFRVFDPAASSPRWERFGKATLPSTIRYRASFVEDPATGEVLVFGGAASNANAGSSDVYVLSKDGATLTQVPLASGAVPEGRSGQGALLVEGALVVAGGAKEGASASSMLDDVWSFDRASKTWKKIGALPAPMGSISMRLAAGSKSEALALGWSATANDQYSLASVVAIDLATGKSRALATKGDAPKTLWNIAPYGTCFVGYESGDTVDGTQPQLWRCKRSGDEIVWDKAPIDAHDEALGGPIELRGAGAADGSRAYFVGRVLWSAAPGK